MRHLAVLFFVGLAWADNSAPTVRDAYVLENGKSEPRRTVRLKDNLNVVVCKSDYEAFSKGQDTPPALSLYLDDQLMKGLPAVVPRILEETTGSASQAACLASSKSKIAAAEAATTTDADKAALADLKAQASQRLVLKYYLDPQFAAQADKKDPWLRLLERPWENRPVPVSVGPVNGIPGASTANIELKRINLGWLAGWAAVFGYALYLFIRYARNSDIIRDSGPLEHPNARRPYSLARTQMALWTFLVAGALVFIFMVTWNENTITPGILVLLGVSFGTTALSSVANGNDAPVKTTGSFLKDLIEGDGPEFHRFQMVLFTVILAVIFVVKTASGLTMPEFDNTLLGLMGISSGTYLGFKLQGR